MSSKRQILSGTVNTMASRLSTALQKSCTALRTSGVSFILLALVIMWAIEITDRWAFDDWVQSHGIHPRKIEGLLGILFAPFLHSDFSHLFSNSVPLFVMGGLVSTRGFRYWSRVTLAVSIAGGFFTWLLASGSNHIGASGIVFGYFGVLLSAAWFERRPAALGAALLAIFLYSGLVAGLVPQKNLSWEGHLSGFLTGVICGKILAKPIGQVDPNDPGDVQPWEIDEPWLT